MCVWFEIYTEMNTIKKSEAVRITPLRVIIKAFSSGIGFTQQKSRNIETHPKSNNHIVVMSIISGANGQRVSTIIVCCRWLKIVCLQK